MDEEAYRECIDKTFEDFTRYDQYIDVVSCWEHFLTEQYSMIDGFCFDRYPAYAPENSGNSVNPSFSVLFDEYYGIIFDVNQRLPSIETEFSEKLETIEQYDQTVEFRAESNERIVPNRHDIVLLIHADNFQTGKLRINNSLEADELDIDSNLVLLSYNYVDEDTNPKYRFQRASMVASNFRDESLPDEKQMSSRLSMDGGSFETIDIPAKAFYDRKATGVLFNSRPPNLYLACYMWQTVFYDLLEDDQRVVWQRGDPKKVLDITIEVDDMAELLNQRYIPDGGVHPDWINDTLEYLCVVETVEKISEERFHIKYRNLHEKRREYSDTLSDRSEHSDLAHLFAEWNCENIVELESGEIDQLKTSDSSHAPDDDSGDLTQPELGEF